MPNYRNNQEDDDIASKVGQSITNSTGGSDPTDAISKLVAAKMRMQPNPNMDITPAKPDPEAVANSRINAAANGSDLSRLSNHLDQSLGVQPAPVPGLPPGMTMDQARQTINPATGLPYSVNQASSPEQDDRNAQAAMKLQYLKHLSGQGQ